MPRSTPGQRLRMGRERLNKTQQQVADEIFKSLAAYKKWEQGHTLPKSYTDITAVCHATGITIGYFIEGDPMDDHEQVMEDSLYTAEELQERTLGALENMPLDLQATVVKLLERLATHVQPD